MEIYYLVDYFLFTFFANLGVIQMSIAKNSSLRFNLGLIIIVLSYFWFFSSKDRNIPTIVEGAQLFVVFGGAAFFAILAAKIFAFSIKKK
ncbi:MAG: hypothetical protein A2Z11_01275 [Candidatus Woykebacteria bacterium RBG_16_43_9]|uniref:Uncharacterized protein n=1 Tax=Candidatus Woykebacteria bacterium RBG_16_43_9 TaxID=1802596 RepID=A0A1G1WBX5_9BACT|nr:MAG: hypothetical protein A2Z11_01275 [Candidatus Woykebacteria bacterium RBG_16_43_9]